MSHSDALKKFGRYYLLDRLAQGGMAEIYRAKTSSVGRPAQILVIKKLFPGHLDNTEFKKMFQSEIQITMGFNHPNIVHLFDYGEEDGQPYIAMEYINGRNLKQLILKFQEQKRPFPIDLALYVIAQVCAGLSYAHSYRDRKTGDPLNIIHRDISPQNILISFDGAVKIIDFGIAKVTHEGHTTTALGIIKGKPGYLSPEQVLSAPLDLRSDIFSLGTVLWELLTSRRLFAGESEQQILLRIEQSEKHIVPPSHYNPQIPPELDEISLKALAPRPDNRYANCEEFQRVVHRLLYQFSPEFNPRSLAVDMRQHYQQELENDRLKLADLEERASELSAFIPPSQINQYCAQSVPIHSAALPNSDDSDKPVTDNALSLEASAESRFPYLKAGSGLLVLLVTGLLLLDSLPKTPQTNIAEDQEVTHVTEPITNPTVQRSKPSAPRIALPALQGASLRLMITPKNPDSITINGIPVDVKLPISIHPLDTPLEIVIAKKGFHSYHKTVVLPSISHAKDKQWKHPVTLLPAEYGFLNLRTTPWTSKAILTIEGKEIRQDTPLQKYRLPIGVHKITLHHEFLGIKKEIQVKIDSNRTKTLEVEMPLSK